MKSVNLIFPNQLFKDLSLINNNNKTFLIEDCEFFNAYNFHKQKLVLHRASMKFYENFLQKNGFDVDYIEFNVNWVEYLKEVGVDEIITYELNNFDLEGKIIKSGFKFSFYKTPMFFSSNEEFAEFFSFKKHYSQTTFYIYMRKKHKLLIDKTSKPIGGKWTYDKENRQKIPSNFKVPPLPKIKENVYVKEAKKYINQHFSNNIGSLEIFNYPITFDEVDLWADDFIQNRLENFGIYQDAIDENNSYLFHSNLSFALNIGLITPQELVTKIINTNVSLNSKEGYIRQIIGWREFVKGIYHSIGKTQIESNFFKCKNYLNHKFYTGETGILPIDNIIKKLLKTGYANHIERLMVLGNFFLLCEINPKEVYRWFMEMSIDSYPWVMCANVFGMSQFADGGLIVTKPYIASSNYIRKMSDYKTDNWSQILDSLFWRFVYMHKDFFNKNPRLGILVSNLNRKNQDEIKKQIFIAEKFLEELLN